MRTLPLIYLTSMLMIIPCLGATDPVVKPQANNSEKSNQERGPNFAKLEVAGVTKDEITAFGLAWRKANQSDEVIAARERLVAARKSYQESTGAEKKDAFKAMRSGADELRIEIRKAIQFADPKLKIETIEKLMDAVEEQIKSKLQDKKNSDTTAGTKNSN